VDRIVAVAYGIYEHLKTILLRFSSDAVWDLVLRQDRLVLNLELRSWLKPRLWSSIQTNLQIPRKIHILCLQKPY